MKNKHNGAESDYPTTVSDVKTPEFDDVTSVHIENVPLLEEFTCKLCSKVFNTKDILLNHEQFFHTDDQTE